MSSDDIDMHRAILKGELVDTRERIREECMVAQTIGQLRIGEELQKSTAVVELAIEQGKSLRAILDLRVHERELVASLAEAKLVVKEVLCESITHRCEAQDTLVKVRDLVKVWLDQSVWGDGTFIARTSSSTRPRQPAGTATT